MARTHQFSGNASTGDGTPANIYIFCMRAQKMPNEVKEGNAIPAFMIGMPEDATLQELHNYICKLIDRPIKRFYFKVGEHKDDNSTQSDVNNDSNSKETSINSDKDHHGLINPTTYVPTNMLAENPDYKDANSLKLKFSGLKQGDHIFHLLKVTGAEWEDIAILTLMPGIPGETYPTSTRVVARIKQEVDVNGKKILEDYAPDNHKEGEISESQEEYYVAQMHKMFGEIRPFTPDTIIFTSASVWLMEYVRLHKLINFADPDERKIWAVSFLYAAALINQKDPVCKRIGITPQKIVEQYDIDEEILTQRYKRILQSVEEEGRTIDELLLSNLAKEPYIQAEVNLVKKLSQTNIKGKSKKSKLHRFK